MSADRVNPPSVKEETAIVRDQHGKFVRGTAAGPGRTSRRSLTEALRNAADADELAAEILRRAMDGSDMLLRYVYDRLEGYPLQAQSVERSDNVQVVLSWGVAGIEAETRELPPLEPLPRVTDADAAAELGEATLRRLAPPTQPP